MPPGDYAVTDRTSRRNVTSELMPDEWHALHNLSKLTGKSKSHHIRIAIKRYLHNPEEGASGTATTVAPSVEAVGGATR